MNRTSWTALTVAGVILVATVALELATRSSRNQRQAADEQGPPAGFPVEPEEILDIPQALEEESSLRTIEVSFYFVRPDGEGLSPESGEIYETRALLDRLKQTVVALIRGPQDGSALLPPLPPGTRLRNLFLDSEGTLYLDFGQELVRQLAPGSSTELLATAGLANTMVMNFPEVRRIRMLVMGEEVQTLSGHVDLSGPLGATPKLVRPWVPLPEEEEEASVVMAAGAGGRQ